MTGTGCFIAVAVMATVGVKGLTEYSLSGNITQLSHNHQLLHSALSLSRVVSRISFLR